MTKKEHILEVAEILFSEHGYEGTSVRTLAQKAKVNIAMISYYFGSKEELFAALVEYRASVLRGKLKYVNTEIEDPIERIELIVDLIVDRIFSNPRFHRLIHRQISLQQRSEINKHIVSILMKNMDEVKKTILDGIKKKVFRKVDVELVIATLFSTTSQVAHSSLLCTKLLGVQTGKSEADDDKVRKRLKNYLKDLLKCYLIEHKKT